MPAAAHLERLRAALEGPVTLGDLSSRLGREGAGLLAVLIALPYLQPLPLAGIGTPFGLLLAAAGWQLARGGEALRLPRFVAERRLDPGMVKKMLGVAETVLLFLEKGTRRRWPAAVKSRAAGASLAVLGLLLAFPIFVPMGNPATAIPAILLGLALLEEDGLLAVLGFLGTAFSLALHAAFVVLLWKGGARLGGSW